MDFLVKSLIVLQLFQRHTLEEKLDCTLIKMLSSRGNSCIMEFPKKATFWSKVVTVHFYLILKISPLLCGDGCTGGSSRYCLKLFEFETRCRKLREFGSKFQIFFFFIICRSKMFRFYSFSIGLTLGLENISLSRSADRTEKHLHRLHRMRR